MRRYAGLLLAVATVLTALGGCDDRDAAKQGSHNEKSRDGVAPAQSGRFGIGWQAVAEGRISTWTFAPPAAALSGGMLAAQSDLPATRLAESGSGDGLTAIRAALMSNRLPVRGSVRIEQLVSHAAASIAPSGSDAQRPRTVLATSPWNDDTLLLWVEIPGQDASGGDGISIEFDPRAVSAFRALGDPSAVPGPVRAADGGPGMVTMIYELSLQPVGRGGGTKANLQLGMLHVAPAAAGAAPRLDQPITVADAVGTIDNAPDIVRLAAAAAGFGELLRGDPAVRDLSCNDVIALAQSVRRPDPDGWRARLIALMYRAQPLIDLPPAESSR